MKLIMTRGLPASGKSTWAREQVDKSNGQIKRINKDDLRAMLDNGKWSKDREAKILKARNTLIRVFLKSGQDVIVDDTNFGPHEEKLRNLAEQYGATFEVQEFNTPVGECIERDAKRANAVGTRVIRDMWVRYVCAPPPIYDPALPRCIISDIDGTLAHMVDRSPYDWKKVGGDKRDAAVIDVLLAYSTLDAADPKIIIFSGRDGSCYNETMAWLQKNGVPTDELYMRTADDNRKDYVIKRELYEKHIKGKYNVKFILDDRQQVVDQWRELGLKCFQVEAGDF